MVEIMVMIVRWCCNINEEWLLWQCVRMLSEKAKNSCLVFCSPVKIWSQPENPSGGRQPAAGRLFSGWKCPPGCAGWCPKKTDNFCILPRCSKSGNFLHLLLTTAPLWRFWRPSTVLPFFRITASRGSLGEEVIWTWICFAVLPPLFTWFYCPCPLFCIGASL